MPTNPRSEAIRFREFAIQLPLPYVSPMNRRRFLASSGVAVFAAFVPSVTRFALADVPNKTFEWKTNELTFTFDVTAGKLRQKRVVPVGAPLGAGDSSGVEVALQCSGENSPDQGMKSSMGQPGARLIFVGTREESTPSGKRLVCTIPTQSFDWMWNRSTNPLLEFR